jgi:hypothetical protein
MQYWWAFLEVRRVGGNRFGAHFVGGLQIANIERCSRLVKAPVHL